MKRFKTVSQTQGANMALKDGTVSPASFAFDFQEVPALVQGFRRMVRGLEFDIAEMALTTYICAKEHGVRFTGLPIFIVRAFHHGAIQVNRHAGIDNPRDLEGRDVGVNRGYTVTTGAWARAILHAELGVDLARVNWVLSGDEHVQSYRPPANVRPIEPGRNLDQMLISGELAGAVGTDIDHPDVVRLFPDPLAAGLAALKGRGHYPINHLIVVRDDVLAANPGLATDIFAAFAAAKQPYMDRLRRGETENAYDDMLCRVLAVTGDPLPYGIEPNRTVLEELLQAAAEQRILTRPVALETLFAKETLTLTG